MKRQPGLISTQLHRALGESPTIWTTRSGGRPLLSGPHSRTLISKRNSPPIRRQRLHLRTCSRRSRCPASASHSRQSINIELPSANDSFRHYFAVGSRVSQRLNSTPKLAI
jgi:hypothetical protein